MAMIMLRATGKNRSMFGIQKDSDWFGLNLIVIGLLKDANMQAFGWFSKVFFLTLAVDA